jgi:hypothetical protein
MSPRTSPWSGTVTGRLLTVLGKPSAVDKKGTRLPSFTSQSLTSSRSGMSEELPPYSPAPPPPVAAVPIKHNRIAGTVYTCSIADQQHDYFWITRAGPLGNYHVSVTTAHTTPLYHIETSRAPDAPDIQLFATSNPLPVAAARITRNPSKSDPLATICTTPPHLAATVWRPLLPAARPDNYMASIPIVTVPGLRGSVRAFAWRTTGRGLELWWRSPTHGAETAAEQPVFARCTFRGSTDYPENVIEVRRGGGLEFELGVVLGMAVVLQLTNRQLK